jgi:hypothetical protein
LATIPAVVGVVVEALLPVVVIVATASIALPAAAVAVMVEAPTAVGPPTIVVGPTPAIRAATAVALIDVVDVVVAVPPTVRVGVGASPLVVGAEIPAALLVKPPLPSVATPTSIAPTPATTFAAPPAITTTSAKELVRGEGSGIRNRVRKGSGTSHRFLSSVLVGNPSSRSLQPLGVRKRFSYTPL